MSCKSKKGGPSTQRTKKYVNSWNAHTTISVLFLFLIKFFFLSTMGGLSWLMRIRMHPSHHPPLPNGPAIISPQYKIK